MVAGISPITPMAKANTVRFPAGSRTERGNRSPHRTLHCFGHPGEAPSRRPDGPNPVLSAPASASGILTAMRRPVRKLGTLEHRGRCAAAHPLFNGGNDPTENAKAAPQNLASPVKCPVILPNLL